MKYEVEQKYHATDLSQVRTALCQMGAEFSDAYRQVDCYFAHPERDFAATDEALRLRRTGNANRITYKGPKIGSATKTRREIELPLPNEHSYPEQFGELLEALGFRPVAQVSKQRTPGKVAWSGQQVEICLDEVEQVGSFLELEIVAEAPQVEAAQETVISLARKLGLTEPIRRSYLEMLLESRRGEDAG